MKTPPCVRRLDGTRYRPFSPSCLVAASLATALLTLGASGRGQVPAAGSPAAASPLPPVSPPAAAPASAAQPAPPVATGVPSAAKQPQAPSSRPERASVVVKRLLGALPPPAAKGADGTVPVPPPPDSCEAKASDKIAALAGGTCDEGCEWLVVEVCDPRKHARSRAGMEESLGGVLAGGFSWSSQVAGLASFLSERTDAELTAWMTSEVERTLCTSAAGPWLPNTCSVLKALESVGTGAVLASAIRADLERLPVLVLAEATSVDAAVFNTFVSVIGRIQRGGDPVDALARLESEDALKTVCDGAAGVSRDMACTLRTLGIAVKLCDDAGRGSSEEIAKAVLIAWDRVTWPQLCTGKACPQKPTQQSIVKLVEAIAALRREIERTSSGGDSKSNGERAAAVLALVMDLVDASAAVLPIPPSVKADYEQISAAFRAVGDVSRGGFADALQRLTALLRSVSAKPGLTALDKQALKVILLLADLASAKDAKEVQSVLQAAAAPVGSWRGKREQGMISIGGLVGVTGGAELPFDTGGGRRLGTAAAGPFAAVGIDFSWPAGQTSTYGFFLSLLDLGQLVNVPILPQAGKESGGTTETASFNDEVQLVQVFSPGLFGRIGLGKSPIVFGAGASIAPELRSYVLRDEATDVEKRSGLFTMVRLHAFFAVDLTLFPVARH